MLYNFVITLVFCHSRL